MQIRFTLKRESVVVFEGYNTQALIIIKAKGLCMPISTGFVELHAIYRELSGIEISRPMTHDLLKHVLIEMGVSITKIVITEFRGTLEDGHFIASLFMEKDGFETELDCRPSDAIVLALQFGAPMFIEEGVFVRGLDWEPTKRFLELLEEKFPMAMQPESD